MTERRQQTSTVDRADTSREIGHVVLTFEFHKEGRMWVGECRELGTATDGRSLEKVARELAKLVALDLDGLEQIGERDRLFKDRGIRVYPADVPAQVTMSVPVNQLNRLVQIRSIKMSAARREQTAG